MTGRSFAVSMATVGVVLVVGVFWLRPPAPLPPEVQKKVERHAIATAVDTAERNRLAREQAAERKREIVAAAARRVLEDSAAARGRRADSLAEVARTAAAAADSAAAWKAAYDARSAEAETLRQTLDSAKVETASSHAQLAKADSIGAVNLRRAERADSLVRDLINVASQGDRCRVLWVLHCPSRTQVAIGGTVAGAIAVVVAKKGVKLRLPIG